MRQAAVDAPRCDGWMSFFGVGGPLRQSESGCHGGKKLTVQGNTMMATEGFILCGAQPDDCAGHTVAAAGDVDGAGIVDMLVLSSQFTGRSRAAERCVRHRWAMDVVGNSRNLEGARNCRSLR